MPYPAITNELPIVLHSAIKAQSHLGWDQLYHGRVSNLWEIAIESLNPHLPISGHQIVMNMVQTIWRYILANWTLRNHHLHQDGGRLSLPNYKQAVQTIYEQKDQLPPEVQAALFHRPLDQMLEQTLAFLQSWIEWSQRYIQQQLKAAKKHAKLKTPNICSFFQCPTPPMNDLQPP